MPGSSDQQPEISIVAPVYNEEENIHLLVEGISSIMDRLGRLYEIVLVDDGSDDSSWKIMKREAADRVNLVLIKFEENAGQTAAFDAGFRKARGKTIVTIDSDLQYDPEDIPRLLDLSSEWDVVCGIRASRRDNWWKQLCSRIANSVRRALTGDPVTDTGCSLKVFRREHLLKLKLYEGMHRFFPTLLRMEGCTITETPVKHLPRRHGVSKYSARNRMLRSLFDCLLIRWMQRRKLRYKVEL
ncbi:glycosyltransferase family 2 protein [Acidobacteriota bacterium]